MAMHFDGTVCPFDSIHEACDSPACCTLMDTIPDYGD